MELKDTIEMMNSDDYKERFIAEYNQTKIRYTKLKTFCDKIELAEIHGVGTAPKHDVPFSLLKEQQRYMGRYLDCLEKRAVIEEITINNI